MKISSYKSLALVAVSGTGKDTVGKSCLYMIPEMTLSVSHTTRPPRNGEQHAKEYYFISKDEFFRKKDLGIFVEWNQYGENFYGTSHEEIARLQKAGKSILFNVDINGALALKRAMGNSLKTIFLQASLEICRERLLKRNTESLDFIEERLRVGEIELERARECDHRIFYGQGANADLAANYIANLLLE